MSSPSTNGTPKFSSASMNTSSAPARIDGSTTGSTTVASTRQRDAPRFWPASSIDRSTAFSAAKVGRTT